MLALATTSTKISHPRIGAYLSPDERRCRGRALRRGHVAPDGNSSHHAGVGNDDRIPMVAGGRVGDRSVTIDASTRPTEHLDRRSLERVRAAERVELAADL